MPTAKLAAACCSRPNGMPWAVAVVGLTLVLAYVVPFGWRHAVLLLTGMMLGATLYLSAFGFTAMYRSAILRGELAGPLAQILLLALTTVLFAPLLARGELLGQSLTGATAPASLSVAAGSLLFGIGMQLGSGCASGTLYAVGAGSPRMIMTLAAFCGGGFLASLHMNFWTALPSAGTIVLGDVIGWPAAVGLQVLVLSVIAAVLIGFTRSRGGQAPPVLFSRKLMLGAITLAILNGLTLVAAGHPWTITWAFTLWGAKAATLLGWMPSPGDLWTAEPQATALRESLLADVTSLMDIGLMLGAFIVATAQGRFVPNLRIGARSLAAAALGGVLMGYGARIAYGCNIGAFVSGVASTSLHGWLWIVFALPGNWIGIYLRPRFGLANERSPSPPSPKP